MLLALTFWSRFRPTVKILTGYLVGVFCAGVIMSGSRGGYLSALVALVAFAALTIWVVQMYNRRILPVALAALVLVGGLLVGGAYYAISQDYTLSNRFDKISNAPQDSRVYFFQAAMDQWRREPVWGTGSGTTLIFGRLYRRIMAPGGDPVHVHNDYLEMLAEYGMVGGALALFFLLAHVGNGLWQARQLTLRRLCNSWTTPRSDSLALTVGALSAVAALMMHSGTDFNMHIPGNALLFAFLFGILANPVSPTSLPPLQQQQWKTARVGVGKWAFGGGLLVLGAALLVTSGQRYRGERLTEQSRAALRDGYYQKSIALAKAAIAADATNPYTYFYMGEAYRASAYGIFIPPLRVALFEKAVDCYLLGLQYLPEDQNLLLRMGQALDGVQRYEEAGDAYRRAIKTDPNKGFLYAYYANHLKLVGDEEGSKENFWIAAHRRLPNPEPFGADEVRSNLEISAAEKAFEKKLENISENSE